MEKMTSAHLASAHSLHSNMLTATAGDCGPHARACFLCCAVLRVCFFAWSCMGKATTFVGLLRGGAKRIIYAHTKGRIPATDVVWQEQVAVRGLDSYQQQQPVALRMSGADGWTTMLWDFRLPE